MPVSQLSAIPGSEEAVSDPSASIDARGNGMSLRQMVDSHSSQTHRRNSVMLAFSAGGGVALSEEQCRAENGAKIIAARKRETVPRSVPPILSVSGIHVSVRLN